MKRNGLRSGLLLLAAVALGGCMAGGMKTVDKSGFLDDYSQLKAGGKDQAALVYIRPGVDFKVYDKIMFERVMVVLSPHADYKVVDPALLKDLTDYYQAALIAAVKDGYQVVDKPGPGVLRVRTAITDVKPSKPLANTMSSITPPGIATSLVVKVASGDNLGTGEAASEIEILDAQTGKRLAAAVDRRQGGKMILRGKWDDTRDAFDFWASRFRERLDDMRGVAVKK